MSQCCSFYFDIQLCFDCLQDPEPSVQRVGTSLHVFFEKLNKISFQVKKLKAQVLNRERDVKDRGQRFNHVPFRFLFQQNAPVKPAKYRIKIYTASDGKSGYIWRMHWKAIWRTICWESGDFYGAQDEWWAAASQHPIQTSEHPTDLEIMLCTVRSCQTG